jgi:hypothetical protein
MRWKFWQRRKPQLKEIEAPVLVQGKACPWASRVCVSTCRAWDGDSCVLMDAHLKAREISKLRLEHREVRRGNHA